MQSLDWNAVRDFLAVARSGSLSQAGGELGVNASTVGRRLEALERRMDLKLFARTPNGYRLTDEGRELITRAEQIESAALAFERRVASAGQVRGRVRLATAENLANFLLVPALPILRARHPELVLEIITDVRTVDLGRRDAELSLRLVRPSRGTMTLRRLATQRYGLYGSIDYLTTRVSDTSFADDAFITWSDDYADLDAARWVADTLDGRPPALVTSRLYTQYLAACQGVGLALLPCFLGDRAQTLRRIRSDADRIAHDIWLVMHSDLSTSARVRAVADFVAEVVGQHESALLGEDSYYREP